MARRFMALAACLLLAVAGCARAQDADYATIADAATAANLSILATVARSTPIADALIDPDFQGIILAPTDEAFKKLNESLPLANLTQEEINGIISYHVIPSDVDFPSIDEAGRSVNSTLLSDQGFPVEAVNANLTFVPYTNADNETGIYIGGIVPGAKVVASVTAAKARIYVIDSVLIPPSTALPNNFSLSVADVAIGNPDFTLLVGAVAEDEEVLSVLADPDSAYIVFAPTNDGFLAFLEAANITLDQVPSLAGTPLVNNILKTHVVDSYPLLAAGLEAGEYTLPTLSGAEITVVITGEGDAREITVAGPGNTEPVNVVAADILAGKSVIHVIDGVILPASTA